MFFFFWKSREFSPDLENLLRDLAGRARDLSAELADLGLPQNPRALGNRSGTTKIDFLDKYARWMQIFDVIPTTQEFLSYRKFPRLDDNSECDALRVPSIGRCNWPLDMGGPDPRCFPKSV